MHLGYFINQYPAVSHSFIRREILAMESLGWRVTRFAIRPEGSGIVDAADKAEFRITKFIIQTPLLEVASIIARQLLFNSVRFFKALAFALRFNAQYEKNLKKTLICFFEACVLCDWARKENIQHIHAHFGTNSTTIVMFAKYLGDISYSFTMHGSEEFDRPESIGFKEKIRAASFVAAISMYTRSQLYRWSDLADWRKIHIVHCGLDTDFLNYTPLPISSEPRIVSVGRFCEQKGQLLLLQAISILVAEGHLLKLVLVGDGPLRGYIEKYIAEHNLSSYVELTGSLSGEQVREQISLARAFVLPSFAEGLPVVIMEAFALGRPVISTYVGGIPELVSDGENGWLLAAGSLEDLVSALRSALLTSPQSMAEMGERGRQRVLEQHAISTEAKKLSELFSNLSEQLPESLKMETERYTAQ
jgi:glycosyltransferase involved in cell wall biosynthesis